MSVISYKGIELHTLCIAFPQSLQFLSPHLRAFLHLELVHKRVILLPDGHLVSGIFFLSLFKSASSF